MTPPESPAWDAMLPHDVERFGAVITDPAERRRWCAAILIGGLPYIWATTGAEQRRRFVEHLALAPGDRVLLIGEGIAGIGIDAELRAQIGGDGELVTIDFMEKVRDTVQSGRFPQWRWDYGDRFADGHFDAIAVFQGVAHPDDWEAAATNLLRTLKPGGTIALGEVIFGPPMADVIRQDAHVLYVFTKLWEVLFPGQAFEEQPYWSLDALAQAFDGRLTEQGSHSDRGIEVFWGRKR
jgi:ubiquinone/menaquinone biosynthesis C-methylase UbiE